jgi:hypothetical protein
MRKLFVLSVMSLLLINASGQEDVLFSDNGYVTYQDDEFFLILILVDDIQASMEAFRRPETPVIYETTSVKKNEPISLFIIYSANEDTINLTYDFRIGEPDGTFSRISYDGIKISDTVINKRVLYPAYATPTIVFDENEDLGTYCFIVQVFNHDVYKKTIMLAFNLLE